jgi:threonyl-tRNA synthetase
MNDLSALRHSCAHLLAAAIGELFPDSLRTIGPSIDSGFYYDFDRLKISETDFPNIEAKMHELVKSWTTITGREVSVSEAKRIFADNPYKLELIDEFSREGQTLTIYRSGDYEDLCRGGHIDHPDRQLKHFKLLSVAGAYWRGDEKNTMLTRIYGTCWPDQSDLDQYLHRLEEARRRDHRKLGRELNLFTFSDLVGSGFPLYTQRGALIRRLVNEYVESVQSRQGYQQVWTPQVAKAELFKISGHYDKYKDDMFRVHSHYSSEEFYLKPMNCPQHTQIYASQPHSYRDLPIRMTDFAMLYRDEKPGELSGLSRVRAFSQDDCHIFCREDQVDTEIDTALTMIKEIMATFGFTYRYRLSTRDPHHPEKYLGHPHIWDKVEAWAEKIMQRNHIAYFPGPGEAAFYAPKMDLMATDALGREWQLSTVQIDYVQPERFNLSYTGPDGLPKQPVMIHRAIVGSPERFLMILIEHFAGAFPTWLAPVQAVILPISDKQLDYANSVATQLKAASIRVELGDKNEPLNARIRDFAAQKVPYILVVGDREAQTQSVSVRPRGQDTSQTLTLTDFQAQLIQEITAKSGTQLI